MVTNTENSSTTEFWNRSALRVTSRAVLLAGMVAVGGSALAQNTVPDAQVESNVLKALAGAPELASEAITTRTMYGTVTLSGTVRDETARRRAENLAANSDGVKKVVDELRLTSEVAAAPAGAAPATDQAAPLVLQSDGTYAPSEVPAASQLAPGQPAPGSAPAEMAQRNDPDNDQALDQQQQGAVQQPAAQTNNQPQLAGVPNGDPNQAPIQRRPMNPYGYPPQGYPQQPGYPQQGQYAQNGQPPYGSQVAGEPVTIPVGALVRVRMNRTLSSDHSQPGTTFDGIVTNDVVANGFIAIPRGATVQGKVIDSKSSGVLKGRGEMSIQLTQVTLGGKVYPIQSDVWAHHGGDKTIETVNKTAGFGAAGALIGALAGGGVGAAVGGGIGAAAGLGSSAASGNGQVYIPAEGMVTFHLAAPAAVATVSEQEMERLSYGVAPGADGQRYRRPARVYVAPGYPGYYPYGPYYGPYGYPRY